jgi:hypothetical protein
VAPESPKFAVGTRLQHRKGGLYTVEITPDLCRIELGAVPAYVYRAADGHLWVRPQAEMEDGRFTPLAD